MSTANLGYEIARNLNESTNDREALNNLAGGSIDADIELFVNNLRNTSTLSWSYNTNSSAIADNKFIFQVDQNFVFTNGDMVNVEGSSLGNLNSNTTYYIVGYDQVAGDNRNQFAFALSTSLNGSPVSLSSISANVDFVRSDPVHKQNILNVSTPRIQDSNQSLVGSDFGYDIGDSFNDAFDAIEGNIDLFNFLRSFKYTVNDSVATDRNIIIEGTLSSFDPAAFNDSAADLLEDKSPGIYISNPFSDVLDIEKTRAFSSDSNPWTEGTGELVTKSSQVNIGDLFFENDIKFTEIDDLNTESGSVTEFTHKIPILVDGVEYFVLLKAT